MFFKTRLIPCIWLDGSIDEMTNW